MTHPLEPAPRAGPQKLQFRPAAQHQGAAAQAATFAWHPRVPSWVLVGYCCLLLVGAGYLVQVQYTDKVRAGGLTEPLLQPALLNAAEAGEITAVDVSENEWVQTGQVLAVIAVGARDAVGEAVDQHAIEQLQLKRRSLVSERDNLAASAEAAHIRLREHREQLLLQQSTATENMNILERRALLAKTEHERLTQLLRERWISPRDARRSELEYLAVQQAAVNGRRELIDTRAELARHDHQMATDEAAARQAQTRIDARIADVRQELRLLTARMHLSVVAPFNGHVADLQAYVGQQVGRGEHMLSVVPPMTMEHRVVLWLPATAGGKVREGMPVRLRYAGYPMTEHGSGAGTVERVSPVARARSPGTLRYRALVAVTALPRAADWIPAGMAVEADVVLARKPLWTWLLEPIINAIARL